MIFLRISYLFCCDKSMKYRWPYFSPFACLHYNIKIYCSGDTTGLGGSFVAIEGGTFSENQGLTMGGVITASGYPTVVTIKGGVFRNNSAK